MLKLNQVNVHKQFDQSLEKLNLLKPQKLFEAALPQNKRNFLLCNGESNAIVSEIELSVVFADENVAEDPQRAVWWRNVDSHESRQANRFSHLSDSQDVVGAFELEIFSAQGEGDFRELRDQRAVDHVFSKGENVWV